MNQPQNLNATHRGHVEVAGADEVDLHPGLEVRPAHVPVQHQLALALFG